MLPGFWIVPGLLSACTLCKEFWKQKEAEEAINEKKTLNKSEKSIPIY